MNIRNLLRKRPRGSSWNVETVSLKLFVQNLLPNFPSDKKFGIKPSLKQQVGAKKRNYRKRRNDGKPHNMNNTKTPPQNATVFC